MFGKLRNKDCPWGLKFWNQGMAIMPKKELKPHFWTTFCTAIGIMLWLVRSLLCPETIEGLQSIWTLYRLTFREDVYFVNCPVDTYNYK